MSFTYSEAVQRLLWLGHEGRDLKWDLNNVSAVLERLGNPERRFASVHIAGTNGKGSDRKSTRLNSSHIQKSRMPSSA